MTLRTMEAALNWVESFSALEGFFDPNFMKRYNKSKTTRSLMVGWLKNFRLPPGRSFGTPEHGGCR